jgi:hypothetical protein
MPGMQPPALPVGTYLDCRLSRLAESEVARHEHFPQAQDDLARPAGRGPGGRRRGPGGGVRGQSPARDAAHRHGGARRGRGVRPHARPGAAVGPGPAVGRPGASPVGRSGSGAAIERGPAVGGAVASPGAAVGYRPAGAEPVASSRAAVGPSQRGAGSRPGEPGSGPGPVQPGARAGSGRKLTGLVSLAGVRPEPSCVSRRLLHSRLCKSLQDHEGAARPARHRQAGRPAETGGARARSGISVTSGVRKPGGS